MDEKTRDRPTWLFGADTDILAIHGPKFLNLDFCFIIKNMHSMPYLFFKNIYERTFFKLQQCQYFDIIFN